MEHTHGTRIRRRRKRSPFKRLMRFLLLLILIGGIGAASYGGYLFYKVKQASDRSYSNLGRTKSPLRSTAVSIGKDPITVLMLGIESYPNQPVRHSDSIILYTVNPQTKQVTVLPIPRDSRMYIPVEGKKDKITNSYAFGDKGKEEKATIDAIEQTFNVPIDYYITTNFQGLTSIVNDVGGVDVNVPFAFHQGTIGGRVHYFKPGPVHLNGDEALAFSRMRKQDPRGDFGRQDRQQQVINAIAKNALSVQSFTKADQIISDAGDNIRTNIPLSQLFGLRNFYQDIHSKKMERLTLKGQDAYINGIYYWEPDPASIQELSQKMRGILGLSNNTTGSASTDGSSSSSDSSNSSDSSSTSSGSSDSSSSNQ